VIALRRLDHASLRVTDVQDAAARWCEQFGLVARLKIGFRRASAQDWRFGVFDRRAAFGAFGSEIVHQAL